jgi:Helix-hairpin-helix domain
MKPTPESSTQEVLAGLVERVTFHNDENGFCVLRAKARGHRELVTVVGHAATISAGEWITASGEWVNDRARGQQFKARFLKTSAPSSIDAIEKYLGSGMIRGIGPAYAKKMVTAFGEKVFDVIEAEPDRLREVTGIGAVRAKRITDAWAEQKIVREIMVFLHSNGVGTASIKASCPILARRSVAVTSTMYPDRWFAQAIVTSPAMFRRTAGPRSLYWLAARDATGSYLDGGKSHELSIPQPVPGKLFWSVTFFSRSPTPFKFPAAPTGLLSFRLPPSRLR